jgi:sulfoxide reductase catalytic subunit YedY
MGQSDYSISSGIWTLEVTGAVDRPAVYSFEELVRRPSVEKDVLLICPGFFAYHGRYRGISIAGLLAEAGLKTGVTRIEFSGPKGFREKSERFALKEVKDDKIFLAYQVNGVPLPRRHGFPMRLVAVDHYGARWVKYVYKVIAVAP